MPRLSPILRRTNGIASRPIGTFTQKIHCHSIPCTIAPLTIGPSATAIPVTALNMPIAVPRFSGGNAAVSSASASGRMNAAPAPWTARAAISMPTLELSAHAAEAAENSAEPGDEHAPASEAVAERRRGHQQHREAQVVGVDGPLQLADRGVQVRAARC